MYEMKVRAHFDAAHQLVGYKGHCANLHGHRWEVEVVIAGTTLDSLNMLVDFGVVKNYLEIGPLFILDHHFLNEALAVATPTAEFIAKWLYDTIRSHITLKVVSVEVWESPDCSIKYSGE